jgi:hypothetical protein
MLETKGTSGAGAFDGRTIGTATALHSTPQVAVAAPGAAGSLADELARLAALRDRGIITRRDFEAARARVLGA